MTRTLDLKQFREDLLAWFADNRRDLPWRRAYDPYQVWISEIMLQQTQMDRVVDYFNRWIQRFPTPESIVGAPEQVILKAWEGLGYYSRARNIQRTAEILVREHQGRVQDDYDYLLALPGIGPYTAAAIMSIAFNRPFPVVDGNVRRVLARVADIDQPVLKKVVRNRFKDLAKQLLTDTMPRDWNQALMELGALVCTPKGAGCHCCPVASQCQARRNGTVAQRPVAVSGPKRIDIVMACGILCRDEKMFIQQRHEGDVWGGLWEFPGGRLKAGESPADAVVRELLEETEFQVTGLRPFATVTHQYTRYRVTLHSFFCGTAGLAAPVLHAAHQYRWVRGEELSEYPFPAGHRKLIDKMRNVRHCLGEYLNS